MRKGGCREPTAKTRGRVPDNEDDDDNEELADRRRPELDESDGRFSNGRGITVKFRSATLALFTTFTRTLRARAKSTPLEGVDTTPASFSRPVPRHNAGYSI